MPCPFGRKRFRHVPEEVRYCVPYDLTAEGRFLRDGYLAVTRERLFVLEGGRILRDIPLRQGTEIVCSPQVDSGLLLSRQDGEERFLCRFTMRHMVRISYVAKGATQFAAGIDRQVESREPGAPLRKVRPRFARRVPVSEMRRWPQPRAAALLGSLQPVYPAAAPADPADRRGGRHQCRYPVHPAGFHRQCPASRLRYIGGRGPLFRYHAGR